eukprot:1789378-Rhodomonas_salina.1
MAGTQPEAEAAGRGPRRWRCRCRNLKARGRAALRPGASQLEHACLRVRVTIRVRPHRAALGPARRRRVAAFTALSPRSFSSFSVEPVRLSARATACVCADPLSDVS